MTTEKSAICRHSFPFLACALWGAVAVAGLVALDRYSARSGETGVPPATWPSGTRIQRSPNQMTLVMFVHPRCACSRASLEELARIQCRCRDRLAIRVVFYSPADRGDSWARTALWEVAERIPGAAVLADQDGNAAATFGALTSGHVCLYDAQGRLVFRGGITARRGHEGDNRGSSAVIAIVRGEPAAAEHTNVFGCPIHPRRTSTPPAMAGGGTTLQTGGAE